MNQSEREKLISAWFVAHEAGAESPIYEENWWAVETLLNLPEENPELLWELILEAIEKEKNEKLLSNLAAGPIEDLMCNYGEEIIDRVEIEAKSNHSFKNCIKDVWLDSNDTPIYKRFYKAAGIEPPFDE